VGGGPPGPPSAAPAATGQGELFRDDAQTNAQVDAATISSLKFVDQGGQEVDLTQYRDKSNVVLVVTRGLQSAPAAYGSYGGAYGSSWPYGDVCLYCATQTASLIKQYDEFKSRGAEVLVVYPVLQVADQAKIKNFEAAVVNRGAPAGPPPFPIVLDLELKAVQKLGIRQDLSKPATYILDKHGQTRFAYVGQTLADRPSVKALLAQLDAINAASP
jgi:peroxiredoxin